jgi:oxygen-independent coproporphyrinogen-3 oxidase
VYVHVPFCSVRCGYCDFNTYTASQLRGFSQTEFADTAISEVRFARDTLAASHAVPRRVETVFFGGGTPTRLPAADLVRILGSIRETWGLAPGAEVTVEANPDSIDAQGLRELAAGGVTRMSFGMQSAVPEVLRTLDRTHDPRRVPLVVRAAGEAGMQVSVDLIYGAPGERMEDWEETVEAACALHPDHVSAYALIVEPGTALARRIRRGELPSPDEDLEAAKYEWAEGRFLREGLHWYETSNWSRDAATRSRHNLNYWMGGDWWGIGPGAHSHVSGVRWWNARHPAAWAGRVRAGESPATGRERLDAQTRYEEWVLLRSRLSEGLPLAGLHPHALAALPGLVSAGLVQAGAAQQGLLVETLRGRLLGDLVVDRLLSDQEIQGYN